MSDMTTTRDGFSTIDITHKPKRLQGENIRTLSEDTSEEGVINREVVPNILTLERAIIYYESNAEGELKVLYTQTAKWLRTLLDRSVKTPDGLDVDKALELLKKAGGK